MYVCQKFLMTFSLRCHQKLFNLISKLKGHRIKRIILTDKEITTLLEARNKIKSTGKFNSSIICTAKFHCRKRSDFPAMRVKVEKDI